MRNYKIERKTAETDIKLFLELDGRGESRISTDCGFLNHMLTLFAKHGGFDLNVDCKGDSDVDYHHTAEDIGLCLGKAFSSALGNKKGIKRYGNMILPMDEALILTAADISGRGGLYFEAEILTQKVGNFDTELCEEFWRAFATNAGVTLHINQLSGKNSHHIIEGMFKSVSRSLRQAVKIDSDFANEVPSSKGVIE